MNEAINPSSPKFSLKSMYIYHEINQIFKLLIVRTLFFLIDNLSIELYIGFWELLIYFSSVTPPLHLRCKSALPPFCLRSWTKGEIGEKWDLQGRKKWVDCPLLEQSTLCTLIESFFGKETICSQNTMHIYQKIIKASVFWIFYYANPFSNSTNMLYDTTFGNMWRICLKAFSK